MKKTWPRRPGPQGEKFSLKVNKIMSVKNLPYEYYSLPYCKPEKVISSAENLGEVLRGDRILNSPYQVRGGGVAAAGEPGSCGPWSGAGSSGGGACRPAFRPLPASCVLSPAAPPPHRASSG